MQIKKTITTLSSILLCCIHLRMVPTNCVCVEPSEVSSKKPPFSHNNLDGQRNPGNWAGCSYDLVKQFQWFSWSSVRESEIRSDTDWPWNILKYMILIKLSDIMHFRAPTKSFSSCWCDFAGLWLWPYLNDVHYNSKLFGGIKMQNHNILNSSAPPSVDASLPIENNRCGKSFEILPLEHALY